MGVRRKARECALQILFEMDIQKEPPTEIVPEYWGVYAGEDSVKEFANRIATGVHANQARIDELITRHADNWRLDRLAVVDRNVLRIAIFELLESAETPRAVVINEAIEIARKFGDAESAQFINGVLDAVAKSVVPEKVP